MKKMILALVAVLAIAGVSFADPLIAVQGENPGDGLQSFTLKTTQTITAFRDIAIDGVVHQANLTEWVYDEILDDDVEVLKATVFKPAASSSVRKWDTELSFTNAATVGVGVGLTPVETNDFSTTALGAGPSGYGLGLGTFALGGGFTFETALASGADFMQIVLPENTQVTLSYWLDIGGFDQQFSQVVGVPEPSTVLLLVAGFACLLVARFRK